MIPTSNCEVKIAAQNIRVNSSAASLDYEKIEDASSRAKIHIIGESDG